MAKRESARPQSNAVKVYRPASEPPPPATTDPPPVKEIFDLQHESGSSVSPGL